MKLTLPGIVVLSLIAHGIAADSGDDATADPPTLVSDYYSHFQKPGFLVDELMTFYTSDVAFVDPTFDIAVKGRDEVRKLYADLGTERTAYRNIRWTIHAVVHDEDDVVIRGNWSGEFHDCPFDVEFMTLWRLRDGKIAEQNDFFAASAFDRQVGWDGTTATCAAAS